MVRRHQPGDRLAVTIVRGTSHTTLSVTLGDLPSA
jgi:S1-C subfamily serine protease